MTDQTMPVPPHVPAELVYDFDIYSATELKREPHRSALHLHRDAPAIFFSPRDGGYWVVTRAAEALDMLRQPEKFSSDPQFNSGLRTPWTLPNQSDPPAHTQYRRIINPAFSPGAINRMEGEIRVFASSLIESVRRNGRCEFLSEIAKIFPVITFLRMVGAALDHREKLVDLTETAVRNPERKARDEAGEALGRYVMDAFAERRQKPGDDLFSQVLNARIDGGRPLNDAELLGMGVLLLLGGLDTVSSMLSFIILFLARNPAHYQRLVAEPGSIANAVEELMRAHGVALMQRGARDDMDYNGIRFRKGDRLYFIPQLFGLDDRQIDDPLRIDFDREFSHHLAFGAGPHRCVGSHLARVEIRVFLEEWTKAIPSFSVAEGAEIATCGGNVWSPLALPLVWKSS